MLSRTLRFCVGFVAWRLRRAIYLSKLPRFEKKLRVMLDWTLDVVFSKDLVQITTLRSPTVTHAEALARESGRDLERALPAR